MLYVDPASGSATMRPLPGDALGGGHVERTVRAAGHRKLVVVFCQIGELARNRQRPRAMKDIVLALNLQIVDMASRIHIDVQLA